MWLSMYGFRTHHQVAGHIRPLVTSNIATRRAAEQTNPLGEGELDCKLVNAGKRDEERHDERTKGAPPVPCSGSAEPRERQTRRYLVDLHAAWRVRRGAGHLRADLANSQFHNPDAHATCEYCMAP